jgi:hypothetical protein
MSIELACDFTSMCQCKSDLERFERKMLENMRKQLMEWAEGVTDFQKACFCKDGLCVAASMLS